MKFSNDDGRRCHESFAVDRRSIGHDRGICAAAALADAASWRQLPARLRDEQRLLRSVARRIRRHSEVGERQLSIRLDELGLVLLAQRALT
jgi:hypothetical protein